MNSAVQKLTKGYAVAKIKRRKRKKGERRGERG